MLGKKKRKNIRMRGTKTHGWGEKKKHRGSGQKGGVGNAGSGKRGDSKKPSFWQDPKYFGKHGFIHHGAKDVTAINIKTLEASIAKLVREKKAVEKNGVYTVDLTALGYDKLLAAGNVVNKFNITIASASKNVAEKVKKAGGEVILKP